VGGLRFGRGETGAGARRNQHAHPVDLPAAALRFGDPAYREMADWAYAYIVDKFWDKTYDGIYWMVDYQGIRSRIASRSTPRLLRLRLSEYFRLTGSREPRIAQRLFRLIEKHSSTRSMGLLEACRPGLGALETCA